MCGDQEDAMPHLFIEVESYAIGLYPEMAVLSSNWWFPCFTNGAGMRELFLYIKTKQYVKTCSNYAYHTGTQLYTRLSLHTYSN